MQANHSCSIIFFLMQLNLWKLIPSCIQFACFLMNFSSKHTASCKFFSMPFGNMNPFFVFSFLVIVKSPFLQHCSEVKRRASALSWVFALGDLCDLGITYCTTWWLVVIQVFVRASVDSLVLGCQQASGSPSTHSKNYTPGHECTTRIALFVDITFKCEE